MRFLILGCLLAQAASSALDELEAALAKNQPDRAVAALASLPDFFFLSDREGQRAAVAAAGRAVRANVPKVRRAAIRALGAMKARGSTRYLLRWLTPPRHFDGPVPASYHEAVKAAGSIADPSALPLLEKMADHEEITLAEAATEALGGYRTLPLQSRKELAFDLIGRLRRLTPVDDPGKKSKTADRTRALRLGRATIRALQRLTGAKHGNLGDWLAWKKRARVVRDPF